jgi:hypothetical protein
MPTARRGLVPPLIACSRKAVPSRLACPTRPFDTTHLASIRTIFACLRPKSAAVFPILLRAVWSAP